jgi:hypothetical protein
VKVEGKGGMIEGITDRIDGIPGALALEVAVRPVGLVSPKKERERKGLDHQQRGTATFRKGITTPSGAENSTFRKVRPM